MENGYGEEYNQAMSDKAQAEAEYEMNIAKQEEIARLEEDIKSLEGEISFIRDKIAKIELM